MHRTFTVVVCHFGDPFWIAELARRIDTTTDAAAVPELLVVDQTRDARTAEALARLPRVRRVVSYEPHLRQVELMGHDHPAALDRACREPFTTSHVLVLDSDCLPVADDWLARLEARLATADCVLAGDWMWGLSHPCLMAMPAALAAQVEFAAGVDPLQIDTGRLVGHQLSLLGHRVDIDPPTAAFRSRRGQLYLSGTVLHVGSASFAGSNDQRLLRQVDPVSDRVVRRAIENGSTTLGPVAHAALVVGSLVRPTRRTLRRMGRAIGIRRRDATSTTHPDPSPPT